jgi:hypothetical protein
LIDQHSTTFDNLPPEGIVRAFGVDYGHLRAPAGGDLYATRCGWPHFAHLMPANGYEGERYARFGERLPGASGNVYHVRTRPVGGHNIEIVVKFSRIAQDVMIVISTMFPNCSLVPNRGLYRPIR